MALNNKKLDELVAEHVMGWYQKPVTDAERHRDPKTGQACFAQQWWASSNQHMFCAADYKPSQNFVQAIDAAKQAVAGQERFWISVDFHGRSFTEEGVVRVSVQDEDALGKDDYEEVWGTDGLSAYNLCIAALKAKGVNLDEWT